ncbi:Threonine dehydrogenase [Nannocystis exedens]|uniref:Threonine dehydrogenase n=1 Tax=Nannocystis exedens TaxID=54 RepID=A0A1I1WK76_9BACT|nr:zinc-dependent alcohol dehydrogenase [Nannocystis exedens]PCC67810.1 glutathione-dependent formaldehyde dehydrogenase [Nannocystis exedens]SFD95567.1 Threonine dehydrogenase [Nannocystis exedens]
MRAVVFRDVGDIRLEDVAEPKLREPSDAIVRLTASAICGTDLHMIRGSMPGMQAGTILGHEGVGVIEALGKEVRNFRVGDRVVIPSTIACGYCSYCRAGYFAQCDRVNPKGPQAGTAFYGGPAESGPFHGLQAEKARIPYAAVNLVKLPDEVSDDQALLLSDIFPTGYMGAEYAEIKDGDTVVVFGCGPVGQFSILSARLMGAVRIFAVDNEPSRLAIAQAQGAEIINFDVDHPVQTLRALTGGIGPDRAIDAVGVDACHAHRGAARAEAERKYDQHARELEEVAPRPNPDGEHWHPGDAPSQALEWAVEALAKAGTLSIVGVYPQTARFFPIGQAMNKNLTVKMGNCHHRKYIPKLLDLVKSGTVDPLQFITRVEPLTDVIAAYKAFDLRRPGWLKVELRPES